MTRSAPAPDHLQSTVATASDAMPTDTDDAGWADELALVFATELEEHLNHVPALAALLVSPDTQAVACAKLSRIFHTIKGSAAVVGRSDLSVIAKCLQDEFATQAEQSGQRPLAAEFFATVQAALDDLCTAAGHAAPQLLHPLAVPHTDARDPGAATTTDEPAELLHAFGIDADEALDKSQRLLLDLERNPHDASVLRELFRHFHTLKGAAAAVGLEDVAQHLHHGESLLDAAVEDRGRFDTPRLVDFLLRLTDSVAGLINAARGVADRPRVVLSNVEAEVGALMAPPSAATAAPTPPVEAEAPSPDTLRTAGADATSLQIDGNHLDALLEHVGQLLGARNRIERRVETLAQLRDQLGAQRARLTEAIETFRERYEFRVAGRSEPAPAEAGPPLQSRPPEEPPASNSTVTTKSACWRVASSSRRPARARLLTSSRAPSMRWATKPRSCRRSHPRYAMASLTCAPFRSTMSSGASSVRCVTPHGRRASTSSCRSTGAPSSSTSPWSIVCTPPCCIWCAMRSRTGSSYQQRGKRVVNQRPARSASSQHCETGR